jgi:hypothetical protein
MIDQIKLAIAAALIAISFVAGFYVEHLRFDNYKEQVEAVAKQQQIRVEEEKKNDATITNSISSEYASSLRQLTSRSGMSNVSKATGTANENTTYSTLVEECSVTTLQLNYLQKWVNEQYSSDNK